MKFTISILFFLLTINIYAQKNVLDHSDVPTIKKERNQGMELMSGKI